MVSMLTLGVKGKKKKKKKSMPKFIFLDILTGWQTTRKSTGDSEGGGSRSAGNDQDLPSPTSSQRTEGSSAAATTPRKTADKAVTKDGKLAFIKNTY